MRRRGRFLVAGVIVLLAIGYLAYTGFVSAARYYLTVDELLAKGEAAYGQRLQLGGKVADGSVQWDPIARRLRFDISNGENAVPVTYSGVVPDTFKPGADVIVEGRYTETGVFEAEGLLAKCPSKFIPVP